jgi:hypothetical protein
LANIVVEVVWLAVNAFDEFAYCKHKLTWGKEKYNPILIF